MDGPNDVAPPGPADVDGLSWGVSSTSGLVVLDTSEASAAVALFPLFRPEVFPIRAMKLPRNKNWTSPTSGGLLAQLVPGLTW